MGSFDAYDKCGLARSIPIVTRSEISDKINAIRDLHLGVPKEWKNDDGDTAERIKQRLEEKKDPPDEAKLYAYAWGLITSLYTALIRQKEMAGIPIPRIWERFLVSFEWIFPFLRLREQELSKKRETERIMPPHRTRKLQIP